MELRKAKKAVDNLHKEKLKRPIDKLVKARKNTRKTVTNLK
jgi:hypothetical protein